MVAPLSRDCSSSFPEKELIARIRDTLKSGVCVVDVDGSYLYRKQQQLNIKSSTLHLPNPPLCGWDAVTDTNTKEMATFVPRVTPGLLYTYLAESCGTSSGHGAFHALQRGYIHWQSGRISQLEINHRHPELCHVRYKIMPSMRPGVYTVHLQLGKEGELATIKRATCECAAGKSASCTYISALVHALVSMCSTLPPLTSSATDLEESDPLPTTSFLCQWNQPRKRKESTLQMAGATFQKPVYGREQKHTLSPITNFDPRPEQYRGTAPTLLQEFLEKVKGEGLGVSLLKDVDTRIWQEDETGSTMIPHSYNYPYRTELVERVRVFKETLVLTQDKIREIERSTRDQSQSSLWFSVRRYRLTASMFGRILHRRPNTPPDALVKELLSAKHVSSHALEWGKSHENHAIEEYKKKQRASGNYGLTVCKAGFHVCEQYPFLGASPDGCIHDPNSEYKFGVLEVKCPFKYRFNTISDAATNSDFSLALVQKGNGQPYPELKPSHAYYAQVQGQLAITERRFCDFVVYTTKDLFIQHILFDEHFWAHELLPNLIDFYDNCFAPAIVSPVHILRMKLHDLRM